MKMLMNFFAQIWAILNQKEVFAFFLGPATGVAYTEAYLIGEGQTAADLADATKGKQILISRGTKAQILAWDASAPAHWVAPDKAWLAAVFNGSTTDFSSEIDLNNSDLIFGTGETVTLTYDTTKKIPFKKEGKKILYDASLGGSTAVTSASGLQNGTSSGGSSSSGTGGTGSGSSSGGTGEPKTGNSATGLAALPMWSWFLIVPVLVVVVVLIVKAIAKAVKKGGKKTVSK
jgi:hypothetical protein